MFPCFRRCCAVIILAAGLPHSSYAQGPLQPPGAPAPTMKTLDQLHERIEIAEERLERRIPLSSFPVTIIRPGSYYLIGSATFAAASGNAITVTTSDVTIDLMGFTLRSTGAVTGDAIHIQNGLRNVTVKNGAIAGVTTVSISGLGDRSWSASGGGFNHGIHIPFGTSTVGCQFSDLRISGCKSDGLLAGGGEGLVVERVTAAHNAGRGIFVETGSVTDCSATLNRDIGILASSGSVTNCTASDNGGRGIAAHSISNCSAFKNGEGGLAGNVVTGSSASSNEGDGISVSDGTVSHSTAKGNSGKGISAAGGVVAFCRAKDNAGIEIDASNGAVVSGSLGN